MWSTGNNSIDSDVEWSSKKESGSRFHCERVNVSNPRAVTATRDITGEGSVNVSIGKHDRAGLKRRDYVALLVGVFLIYQSHDNVFSAARMDEFVKFLTHFGFAYPELMAPLSVYAQFLAGIGFILGLFTRWLGLITCFNFIVALWMVDSLNPYPGWWPSGVLIFLGLYFGLRGSGRYGLDALLEGSRGRR